MSKLRLALVKTLILLEFVKTRYTKKLCIAKVDFAWNFGIGYHKRVEEFSEVEFYLVPFMIVSITSFSSSQATLGNNQFKEN